VARHGAAKSILFGESIDPDDSIAALDAVTFDDVVEVARGIDPTTLAVACVGPHEVAEFEV
jgi:predicted Zn-dependent peptidase